MTGASLEFEKLTESIIGGFFKVYRYHGFGLIDDAVIVEIKAGSPLDPSAKRQLFNYLRASGKSVGLLFHFGPEPKVYRQICTPHFQETQKVKSAPVR